LVKKTVCSIIIFVLLFATVPGNCEPFLMTRQNFSFQFAYAALLCKTDHIDYFVNDYMITHKSDSGTSLEISIPPANSSVCLYFSPNGINMKEIIVFCKGAVDDKTGDNFVLLLWELCYTTGAYATMEEAQDFLNELGIYFEDGRAGFLDRNGKRYSWVLNNNAGFIFSIQPL